MPPARIVAPGDSGRVRDLATPAPARQARSAVPGEALAGLRDYPGAKGGAGVWQTIVNQVPPHRLWIEAFVGSGAVTRALRPAERRIVIDRDAAVVAAWQAVPGVSAVCADAVQWLAETRFGMNPADVAIYCDPPYLRSVRSCPRDYYRHEFASEAEHVRLLAVLRALPARVILSGYPSALYRRELPGWRTVTFQTVTHRGQKVTECLWLNFPEPFALHDYRWLGRNFRERERIKRKQARWRRRLLAMPLLERAAILETVAGLLAASDAPGPIVGNGERIPGTGSAAASPELPLRDLASPGEAAWPDTESRPGEGNPCRALVHCPGGYEPTWHREMALLSGVLNRLRLAAGLSFAKVDWLAVCACGRKWCNFRSLADYRATCLAVAAQCPPASAPLSALPAPPSL